MGEWHYMHDGISHGPVSEDRMRALVDSGDVAPTDLVWRAGMAEWCEAGRATGLSAGRPPPVPAAPGGEAPAVPATSGKAVGALVSSVVGLVACLFIGQIVGIILGHSARREIAGSGGRLGGDGVAIAAIVVGWVGLVVDVLLVLFIAAAFAMGMASALR